MKVGDMIVEWCVEIRQGGRWVIFDVFGRKSDAQVAASSLRHLGCSVQVVGRPVPPDREVL